MHLEDFTLTIQSVFHINGLLRKCTEMDESSKNTMNGTILVDAANQNPASVCSLEKIIVTVLVQLS